MDGAKFQKVLPLDEEVQLVNGWCDRKTQSPLRMDSFSGWPIPSGHPRDAYIQAMLAGFNRWRGVGGHSGVKGNRESYGNTMFKVLKYVSERISSSLVKNNLGIFDGSGFLLTSVNTKSF